jgi:hypothetical protein
VNEPLTPGETPASLAPKTRSAVRELIALLQSLDAKFESGEHAMRDEQSMIEAYKWMFSVLQVGLDAFVWGEPANPNFVDIVGITKKWGGDNADAFYQYAPIDPARTYIVSGVAADAVYFSLTVYGGPNDGHYSERIIGWVNDSDLELDAERGFRFTISPDPFEGPGIRLEPDAVAAITRDYLADPSSGRRVQWRIEAVDPPTTVRQVDAEVARRFTAATTWLADQWNLVPIPLGEPNRVDDPYPVPTTTFGWAAGDAAYAMGSFELADGEALEIRGRSPVCRFWSLCLWNQLLHTFDYTYERVTINGEQVVYEDDGSWTIVVSATDTGHPNWVSTQGHPRGLLWFRWFLPAETPARPTVRVVPVAHS